MLCTHSAASKMAFIFIIVAMSAQWWPILPSIALILICLTLVILLIPLYPKNNQLPYALGALFGLLWMASVGHSYLLWQLPSEKIRQTVVVEAKILQYSQSADKQKLIIDVHLLDNEPVKFNAKVNAYKFAQHFQSGQTVRLCVRLIPAHGLQNPVTFDYWRWLVSRNIRVTGYIKECELNTVLLPASGLSTKLKYRLQGAKVQAQKWLLAILFADRQQLTPEDWQLMQTTGVAHLFTLSGLHMGAVFLVFSGVAKCCLFVLHWFMPSKQMFNSKLLVYVLSIAMSWGFVALCGYPIPLVRAALALSLFIILLACNQHMTLSQGILWILVMCLLLFPLSIYGLSVYLSFFAVTVLCFWGWRFTSSYSSLAARVKYFIALQLGLTLFMQLATGFAFSTVHTSSFFVNVFAIPFVTFVIVPMGCLATLCLWLIPVVGESLMRAIGSLLQWFIDILFLLPTYSFVLQWSAMPWLLLCALLFLLFLPSARVLRLAVCAVAIISFVFSVSYLFNKRPAWSIHIFDVGQGMALLVDSGEQQMLVDTGGAFAKSNTMAESVITPVLSYLPSKHIDMGVITHFDKDHAAGQQWLTDNNYVREWRSIYRGCLAGDVWNLGELTVTVLWPTLVAMRNSAWSKNDLSCVLMVSDGKTSLLIPGDIEKHAEQRILELYPLLTANILIAPHHGSKSSSTFEWVNKVSPQYVVFTNGFQNRWGFPNKSVLERYENAGSRVLETAKDGYINIAIYETPNADTNNIRVKTWYADLQPRWYKSR